MAGKRESKGVGGGWERRRVMKEGDGRENARGRGREGGGEKGTERAKGNETKGG